MFAIEVAFLTGRYVATSFADRDRAEWPPHPARLFSALVAAHFEALEPAPEERAALQWLERQGAPEIDAPEASHRDAVTVFVPVNDTSVVGSLDDEAAARDEARRARDEARAAGGKVLAAAEKTLAKAETKLADATRKAIAPVPAGKEGKTGPSEAASLLPERRKRQPRTFPSVTPAAPRAVFAWPAAEPSAAERAALDALAARVARLGHSSSLVSLRLSDEAPAACWVPAASDARPDPRDVVLRVVGAGQLEQLEAMHDADPLKGDTPGRVMPASFQRYTRPSAAPAKVAPAPVLGDDWIVLQRMDGARLPSVRAAYVARTLRNALMAAHGPGAPEILSGHRPEGARSEQPHVAYVPLPNVGHQHADGAILGVALVLPRAATREERRAVYDALDRWERARREEQGDEEDIPRLPLLLGRSGELWVARVEGRATRATLRAETWCAPSRWWASATPVALDRNPGELRSKDPRKEAAAYAEASESVARACAHIGLPRPSSVVVTPAAPLAGGDKTRHFPPFNTGQTPRVLVHAALTFDEEVRGPILLGAGRYFGLGLFRPLEASWLR
ncbi:hypothetical protein A7982_12355 [Minicystis rosea]|nr:hypothetical protein A7982_12355 [Minicystis rosea]